MNELVVYPSGLPAGANSTRLHGLSLCAGAGGIDLGLTIACPGYRTVCYVEREAYAAATLVARMEDKALDCAPLWDDISTFDGRPWRGTVDLLTGGYPCTPFSVAGKRKGAEDPRHLWPHFARIISECQPEWVFLENVANHINIGYREVRGELEKLGYKVTEGLFTAAEVGAPHKRQRLFVLAHAERGGRRQSTGDPYRQGQPLCPTQRQEGASGIGPSREDVVAPLAVADAACELHDWTGKRRSGGWDEPADQCCAVANADGQRRMQAERGQSPLNRSDPCQPNVADPGGTRCQGREQPGACGDERHRAQAHGSAGELRGAFPPGPGDHEGWQRYLRSTPDTEPSVRRGADGLAYRVDQLAVPLIVNSAYRSPDYNRQVGGAKHSMHLQGAAFDISMANHDPESFEAAARAVGFTGFGFYPKDLEDEADWLEKAQLELPPPTDAVEEASGFGLEYVLIQRARLGCQVDGGRYKIGSYTHEDAEIIAATLAGLPDALGGKRMAIRMAELARAGLTPNWMPGAVPHCVPVETRRNQHGERAKTEVVGVERVLYRGRWRTVEVLACPVTWRPHPEQIAGARRAYEDWWQALAWVGEGLVGGGMLRDIALTKAMPRAKPWNPR